MDDLSRATHAHAGALYRLLRALASIGVFAEQADGRFALTPLAATLQSDTPNSIRAVLLLAGSSFHWNSWSNLEHSIMTGEVAFEHVHGQRFFDYLTAHPDAGATFDGWMTRLSQLQRFLDAGPPPVVFTLGTSAVMAAGNFYHESARTATLLGRRAVLLIGRDPANRLPEPLPTDVLVCDHAPYSLLFPRAAAVVHSGGIGTTAQALRAGCPMLVVPFAHDQPDNAARVTRLGVARTLYPQRYTAPRVARELGVLLEESCYATRAAAIARVVQSENGVTTGCDEIVSPATNPATNTD